MLFRSTHCLVDYRYSSFVAFPIKLNGEVVNTVQALWLKDKNEVKEEQYQDFYRYVCVYILMT